MKTNPIKSIAMASLAALSFAAPMAIGTPASAESRHEQRWDRHDDQRDYRDNRSDDRRDYRDNRRDDRRDYRDSRRDDRRDYRHEWRRGDRASYDDRRYWRNVDYRDYRGRNWREPPRGYHYVRDNRSGDYLLVGIATGVVLGIIASH